MKDRYKKVLELLDTEGPCLHALLARLTRREDVTGDLLQELVTRLCQSNGLERARDPFAYAYRAATNLAFEWRRGQQPHRPSDAENRDTPGAAPSPLGAIIDDEELERTEKEIRRLVDEQVRERIARSRPGRGERPGAGNGSAQTLPEFQCFTWDNRIDLQGGRPVFRGAVKLGEAIERIIGLSGFEYDLPKVLQDVNIPGDWVVRKGSSKEARLAAFEKIVREYTGRTIAFRESRVEREVVVARGVFHFQPLPGAYNSSWIHVYSDRLDPDTRGGGGSGSLAHFIRNLGDININQQVIDETQGNRDLQVHYGWHESGYVRQITDEKERAVKLRMVLDNLARQTGLTFTIERRIIVVWLISDEGNRG